MSKGTDTKAKSTKTEEKAEETVLRTKDIAEHLGITPRALRIILRKEEFFPDKTYTRYSFKSLTDPVVRRIEKFLAGDGKNETKAETKAETKVSKKSKKDKKSKRTESEE